MRIGLLPGLRGEAREWDALRPLLPGARVLGLPDAPLATLDAIAGALGPLPDLDVLVGASFGGLVARALRARGLTSARLVLIGTLPHPTAPPAARRCGLLARGVAALPGPAYRRLYGARARGEWAEDSPEPWSPADLPAPAVLAARLGAIARWGIPAIPSGTQVLWGERDRFVTWTPAEVRAWGAVPAALPGAHRPHLSHPHAVASHVLLTG